MAYQIFWRIPFKSLRADTDYVVNVYKDGSLPYGYPLTLKGAAQPFETEENNNEDMFDPIRTQSGYLRIVDDGKAVSLANTEVSFDWKDFIPLTDTDRPVTLTHTENGQTIVDWQGYIQAQNFSSELYMNPQEREFPIQCALMAMSRIDVGQNAFNGVKNFASILDYALSTVPQLNFTNIYIQGGADARSWLLKKIDWMVFGELNDDGYYDSKHSVTDAVEGLCTYWGWTIRTVGQNIYMTCVDDTTSVNFLNLTRAQLSTLAAGTSAGTIDTSGYNTTTIGNVFASTDNSDMQMRGCNKAEITSDSGDIDEKIVFAFPETFLEEMAATGFHDETGGTKITTDKYSFDTDLMLGYVVNITDASFNIRRIATGNYHPIIRLKVEYSTSSIVVFESKKMHNFGGGVLHVSGKVDSIYEGGTMYLRVGVGTTQGTALWWHPNSLGEYGWYSNQEEFPSVISSNGLFGASMPTDGSTPLYGYIFIQILGYYDPSSEYSACDIEDFKCSFARNDLPYKLDPARVPSNTYKAKNNAVLHETWTANCIFSTDNNSKFGPGVVLNEDNTYFIGWNYGTHQNATSLTPQQAGYPVINLGDATTPEQHLVNRVVKFWEQSRRHIKCELLSHLVSNITPRHKATVDGTTLYPYAISREWRDDILRLSLIEI